MTCRPGEAAVDWNDLSGLNGVGWKHWTGLVAFRGAGWVGVACHLTDDWGDRSFDQACGWTVFCHPPVVLGRRLADRLCGCGRWRSALRGCSDACYYRDLYHDANARPLAHP